jgi:hypothetical protein
VKLKLMHRIRKWITRSNDEEEQEITSEEEIAEYAQFGRYMQRYADEHMVLSDKAMHSSEALDLFRHTVRSYGILLVQFSELIGHTEQTTKRLKHSNRVLLTVLRTGAIVNGLVIGVLLLLFLKFNVTFHVDCPMTNQVQKVNPKSSSSR